MSTKWLYLTVQAAPPPVKGGEWTSEEVRKRDNIDNNIDVKIFPLVKDYSTSELIRQINQKSE